MKINTLVFITLSFFLVSGCTLTAKDMIPTSTAEDMIRAALKEQRAELEKETKISFSLLTDADVNYKANAVDNVWDIDSEGKDLPSGTHISLKVLELTDDSMLLGADQESLNQDLEAALGKTYIDHNDYVLAPGQFKFIDFGSIYKKTRYIGIIAGYHDISGSTWKKAFKLDLSNKRLSLVVHLTKQEVIIKAED